MDRDFDEFDRSPDSIPPPLLEDLRILYARQMPVPGHLDERILARARSRLQAGRRSRQLVRWAPLAGLAAAACLGLWLSGGLWNAGGPASAPALPAPQAALREDVDGNGQVNILDAFTLARRIDQGAGGLDSWDLDGDGHVGQSDVDAIARRAVRIQ